MHYRRFIFLNFIFLFQMDLFKAIKVASDAVSFLQGNRVDQQRQPIDNSFEVYILLKYISKDFYVSNYKISHHICLIKGRDDKTYYTQLQTENGDMDGTIVTEFKSDYNFLPGTIYYVPIGRTKRTITEMRNYQQNSKFNGQKYDLLLRNCQHYVDDFVKFLNVYDRPACNENPTNHELANLVLDNISNIKFCVHHTQMNLEPAFDVFKFAASAYNSYYSKPDDKE